MVYALVPSKIAATIASYVVGQCTKLCQRGYCVNDLVTKGIATIPCSNYVASYIVE